MSENLATAEDALSGLLQLRAAQVGNPLSGIPVALGDPGSGLRDKHVWIADAADVVRRADSTGSTDATWEDEILLHVMVWVAAKGNDYPALRNVGKSIVHEIDTLVRADPDLGAAVWDTQVMRIERMGAGTQEGRALLHDIHIQVNGYVRSPPA